jgi:hypothetical protein
MLTVRRTASFALLFVLALTPRAGAQARVGARAEVTLGRSWIEARFPALELAQMGCESTRALPSGETVRWYQWYVAADYPDASYPKNHFQALYVIVELPDDVQLTAARLDSALATARITVDEASGEPAIGGTSVRPRLARAQLDGGRVSLRVEDLAAARAFRATRADSVSVGWCQRGEVVSALTVLLKRQR